MPGRFGLQQAQDQIRQNYDGNGQSQYNNNQNGQGQFNNFQGQGQYQAGPPQFDNNSGYNQPGNNYNRPPAGKFDGPGDRGPPPGARGAPSGGPPGRGPPPPAQSGPGGFAPGTGVDPARMSRRDEQPSRVITNTRMELPPEAYRLEGQNVSTLFCFFLSCSRDGSAFVVLFTPSFILQASSLAVKSAHSPHFISSEFPLNPGKLRLSQQFTRHSNTS